MTLIDTSSWIEALRQDGDPSTRDRVRALLLADQACWCDVVRLELWHGVRGAAERKVMAQLNKDVSLLPTTDVVWSKACELARRSRARGLTVPATDLIIAACAWAHGVPLEHRDRHLTALMKLID
jgi:predicted nucleic acid-binding protein